MVKTHSKKKHSNKSRVAEMEGELWSTVASKRMTRNNACCREEEKAQQQLDEWLIPNFQSPTQDVLHILEVCIERLTDEEVRGTRNNTDTDSAGSSVETDWVIPDLRNTRLSGANVTPLDQ